MPPFQLDVVVSTATADWLSRNAAKTAVRDRRTEGIKSEVTGQKAEGRGQRPDVSRGAGREGVKWKRMRLKQPVWVRCFHQVKARLGCEQEHRVRGLSNGNLSKFDKIFQGLNLAEIGTVFGAAFLDFEDRI